MDHGSRPRSSRDGLDVGGRVGPDLDDESREHPESSEVLRKVRTPAASFSYADIGLGHRGSVRVTCLKMFWCARSGRLGLPVARARGPALAVEPVGLLRMGPHRLLRRFRRHQAVPEAGHDPRLMESTVVPTWHALARCGCARVSRKNFITVSRHSRPASGRTRHARSRRAHSRIERPPSARPRRCDGRAQDRRNRKPGGRAPAPDAPHPR